MRFRINQLIGYFPNREEYLWAEAIDLSAGGMSCASKEAVDPLTNLFMMIGVPTEGGERLVRCEGHVTWSRMDEARCVFGVRFDRIDQDDEPFFQNWIGELEPVNNSGPPLSPPPAARFS